MGFGSLVRQCPVFVLTAAGNVFVFRVLVFPNLGGCKKTYKLMYKITLTEADVFRLLVIFAVCIACVAGRDLEKEKVHLLEWDKPTNNFLFRGNEPKVCV